MPPKTGIPGQEDIRDSLSTTKKLVRGFSIVLVSVGLGLLWFFTWLGEELVQDERAMMDTSIPQLASNFNLEWLDKIERRLLNSDSTHKEIEQEFKALQMRHHSMKVVLDGETTIFTHGVLQAESLFSSSGANHALAIVVPYQLNPTGRPRMQLYKSHSGLAHVLGLLQYLRGKHDHDTGPVSWLSKDIVVVCVGTSRDEVNMQQAFSLWSDRYFDTIGEDWKDEFPRAKGFFLSTIVLDLPFFAVFNELNIQTVGPNALQCNMDLVATISQAMDQFHIRGVIENDFDNFLYTTSAESLQLVQERKSLARVLIQMANSQATGLHGEFLKRNMDALTLRAEYNFEWADLEEPQVKLFSLLEKWLRSSSAIHEKLHHSSQSDYILLSTQRTVLMKRYFPIFFLFWLPMLIETWISYSVVNPSIRILSLAQGVALYCSTLIYGWSLHKSAWIRHRIAELLFTEQNSDTELLAFCLWAAAGLCVWGGVMFVYLTDNNLSFAGCRCVLLMVMAYHSATTVVTNWALVILFVPFYILVLVSTPDRGSRKYEHIAGKKLFSLNEESIEHARVWCARVLNLLLTAVLNPVIVVFGLSRLQGRSLVDFLIDLLGTDPRLGILRRHLFVVLTPWILSNCVVMWGASPD